MIENSDIPSFTTKIYSNEIWNNNWNSHVMNIVGENKGKVIFQDWWSKFIMLKFGLITEILSYWI